MLDLEQPGQAETVRVEQGERRVFAGGPGAGADDGVLAARVVAGHLLVEPREQVTGGGGVPAPLPQPFVLAFDERPRVAVGGRAGRRAERRHPARHRFEHDRAVRAERRRSGVGRVAGVLDGHRRAEHRYAVRQVAMPLLRFVVVRRCPPASSPRWNHRPNFRRTFSVVSIPYHIRANQPRQISSHIAGMNHALALVALRAILRLVAHTTLRAHDALASAPENMVSVPRCTSGLFTPNAWADEHEGSLLRRWYHHRYERTHEANHENHQSRPHHQGHPTRGILGAHG